MKNRLLLVGLLFLFTTCDTSNNVSPDFRRFFVMYYGTEGDQKGVDLIVNADGTMIILGNSLLPSGDQNIFVIKVDPEGRVIWEKSIGENNENAVDIELIKSGANEGKFIIAANKTDQSVSRIHLHIIDTEGNPLNDGVTIPLHAAGNVQAIKSITSLENAPGFAITGYADGALIEESSPEISPTNDNQDILGFELDDQLSITDTIVTKGGELNGSGVKIFETAQGSYGQFILFGYSDRPYNSNLFKFKYTYDVLVSGIPVGKVIGSDTEDNILATAIRTPSAPGSGFLMGGTTRTSPQSGEIFLVKLSENLAIKTFERKFTLGSNMECVALDNAAEGYYVLGNEFNTDGRRNITLIKTSSDGFEEWIKSFGTPGGDDEAAAVASLPDGRIAIVGTMETQAKKKVALIIVNINGDF